MLSPGPLLDNFHGIDLSKFILGGDGGVAFATSEEIHTNIYQVIVNSMHERKVEMAQRVQGFVGLPGGFGTFEEVR